VISSRTPEGPLNHCPVCGSVVRIEPSLPFGDALCPHCGHLLWFVALSDRTSLFLPSEDAERRERVLELVVEKLGVKRELLSANASESLLNLGADSLDMVELVMALEDEFSNG